MKRKLKFIITKVQPIITFTMKIMGLMFIATLISCSPEEAAQLPGCNKPMEALDGRDTVLVIGDSVSLGYTPVVKDNLSLFQVIHNSCNATSSINGVKKIKEWTDHSPRWSVCTFNHGLWDINPKYKVGIDKYEANLRYEADVLKAKCDKVIFVTTTMVDSSKGGHRNPVNVDIYNDRAVQVMNEMNIPICDLNRASHDISHELVDPVHYSPEGYKYLGDEVTNCINTL